MIFWKVLAGDIDPAIRTHSAFFSVWKKYGFTPEGFNLATLSVQVFLCTSTNLVTLVRFMCFQEVHVDVQQGLVCFKKLKLLCLHIILV